MDLPAGSLFLGLDSSTQSMKATALDHNLRSVASALVHFDSALPHYNTKDGVHRDPHTGGRITAPPQMWVEALELVLDKLRQDSFPFQRVAAISGSGQQHGSVYWKRGARDTLRSLQATQSMVSQLACSFATSESPVWMDSSTSAQCAAIEQALGGPLALSQLTGSRAYERFTGPQIRGIYERQPNVYEDTERISLVSSFNASLLVGDYAAIDTSDGGGMNLMDLAARRWSPEVLQATAPELEGRLGPLVASHEVVGRISAFFVERYGFAKDCQVVAWSGDNPCSLAGLALDRAGDMAISLGTSDTGHVFANPVDPASYMAMLCYKNGSLTRQHIRDRCAGGSWDTFNQLLDQSPPLNGGKLGFYYKDAEILPPLPAGEHRFDTARSSEGAVGSPVESYDAATEVRAVVEGQFMSMRAHAERMGMPSPPERIIATGGASSNLHILRLLASIFGSDVYTAQRPDSASLGAALRAAHGWVCHKQGRFIPYAQVLKAGAEDCAAKLVLAIKAGPDDLRCGYGELASKRVQIEEHLLRQNVTQS
eukprot:jgi/Mesen1/7749/ME000407S06974